MQRIQYHLTVCGEEGTERLVLTEGSQSGPVSVWDLRQPKELISWPDTGMVQVFPDVGVLVLQTCSYDNTIVCTLATGAHRDLPIATRISWAQVWERRLYLASVGTQMWCLDLETHELISNYLTPEVWSHKMHGPVAVCSNADGKLAIVHLATRQRLLDITGGVTVEAAWLHSDCLFVLSRQASFFAHKYSLAMVDLTAAKQCQRILLTYEHKMTTAPIKFALFPGVHAPIATLNGKIHVLPAPIVTPQPSE